MVSNELSLLHAYILCLFLYITIEDSDYAQRLKYYKSVIVYLQLNINSGRFVFM